MGLSGPIILLLLGRRRRRGLLSPPCSGRALPSLPYFVIRCFALLCFTLFHPTLLDCTLRYGTRRYFILLYSTLPQTPGSLSVTRSFPTAGGQASGVMAFSNHT